MLLDRARENGVNRHKIDMSTYEKYTVTRRFRPDEGCALGPDCEDGECVRLYLTYAGGPQEANEKSFAARSQSCGQPYGISEITTKAELLVGDIVD